MSAPLGATGRDPIEELVFEALEIIEREGPSALEGLYRAHPSRAEALRARIESLRSAGLIDDPARAELPATIGEFQILARLGEGGMGVVFLAEQPSLGRRVALKLIRPEHLYFSGARERFQREVAAVARLSHPGVVAVFSVGEADGTPFCAMEAIEGATLAEILRELAGRRPEELDGGDLLAALRRCMQRRDGARASGAAGDLFAGSWTQVATRIVERVAEALSHAHERGVLHRDVKPGNVMITESGRVVLLDFGLASLQGASRLTRTGSMLGSLPYMSPEQVDGSSEIEARSDVWSAGVVYYELLTLELPFRSSNELDLRRDIADAHPTPPRSLHAGLGWDAETVCSTALERDPAQRYASASAFLEDLRAVLELRPIKARRPGPWRQLERLPRRYPVRTAIAVFGLVLLLGGPLVFGAIQRNARVRIESANGRVKLANEELASALDAANRALGRAEFNFDRALAAVDAMLRRTAESRLANVPRTAKLRRQLLEDALAFHTELAASEPGDRRAREERARSLVRVGALRLELGMLRDALEVLDRSIAELDAALPESPERSKLLRDLARGHELRARALSRSGRRDEALPANAAAVRTQRELIALEPASRTARAQLVDLEISEAQGLAESGRLEAARALLGRLWDELAGDDAAALPDLWYLQASVARAQAITAVHSGELVAGDEAFDRARAALAGPEGEERDDPRRRAMVATVLEQQAELATQRRDWVRARGLLDEAIGAFESYSRDEPDVPDWRTRLAGLLGTRADNCNSFGEPERGLADHARSIELLAALHREFPDEVATGRRLAIAYAMRAGTLGNLGDASAGCADMQRSFEVFEAVLATHPGDAQSEANYVAALCNAVSLMRAAGDEAAIRPAIDRALALSAESRFGEHERVRTEVLLTAAEERRRSGDAAAAGARYEEALAVARAHWGEAPGDPSRAYNFVLASNELGSFLIEQGRAEEAQSVLDAALASARRISAEGPMIGTQMLAFVQLNLARASLAEDDTAAARSYFGMALAETPFDADSLAATPHLAALFTHPDLADLVAARRPIR